MIILLHFKFKENLLNTKENKMAIYSELNGNILNKLLHAAISELDAISTYSSIIESTDDPIIKKTLADISAEESVHHGQLTGLIKYINETYKKKFTEGEREFEIDLEKSKK